MSPRSLVGMTQGARKRAARATVDNLCGSGSGAVLRMHRLLRQKPSHVTAGQIVAWYHGVRSKYRIGERLAPCFYCEGPEAIASHRCPTMTRTWLLKPARPTCDGSGLVPARRGRR